MHIYLSLPLRGINKRFQANATLENICVTHTVKQSRSTLLDGVIDDQRDALYDMWQCVTWSFKAVYYMSCLVWIATNWDHYLDFWPLIVSICLLVSTAKSLKEFGKLISLIEDERDRMVSPLSSAKDKTKLIKEIILPTVDVMENTCTNGHHWSISLLVSFKDWLGFRRFVGEVKN